MFDLWMSWVFFIFFLFTEFEILVIYIDMSFNSFCRTDLKFCSCSDDTTVKVWDFARCQEEKSLTGNCCLFLQHIIY